MLVLTVEPDDYGNAALRGVLSSGAFAGAGEGWFTLKQIEVFGSRLVEVSKYVESEASIMGGVLDDGGDIECATLSIRAYPIDTLGHFGVHVVLSTNGVAETRPESVCRVSVELQADASSLESVGRDIVSLSKGGRDEAVLNPVA